MTMRSEEDIEELAEKASVARRKPSKFPGMTYEEGVSAALDWVIGLEDMNPLADE